MLAGSKEKETFREGFPDYANCIANLGNSILEEFGIYENRGKLYILEPYKKRAIKICISANDSSSDYISCQWADVM